MLVKRPRSLAIDSRAVELEVRAAELDGLDTDLVAIAIAEGDALPDGLRDARGAADVKTGFRKLALLHPESPARMLVVGLGAREVLDPERLRVAAALVAARAGSLDASSRTQ